MSHLPEFPRQTPYLNTDWLDEIRLEFDAMRNEVRDLGIAEYLVEDVDPADLGGAMLVTMERDVLAGLSVIEEWGNDPSLTIKTQLDQLSQVTRQYGDLLNENMVEFLNKQRDNLYEIHTYESGIDDAAQQYYAAANEKDVYTYEEAFRDLFDREDMKALKDVAQTIGEEGSVYEYLEVRLKFVLDNTFYEEFPETMAGPAEMRGALEDVARTFARPEVHNLLKLSTQEEMIEHLKSLKQDMEEEIDSRETKEASLPTVPKGKSSGFSLA